jgi:hypothetical protein
VTTTRVLIEGVINMVTKKQMIRTELEEIVELCEAAIEIKQLPYKLLARPMEVYDV